MSRAQYIADWRRRGLILTSKEEGYEIVNRYLNSTHCEKCGNKYKSNYDRNMDHSHDIFDKYGYFRNILCRSCNLKRCKIHSDNTSGYNGIYKHYDKTSKQGFIWRFQVTLNGKQTKIKSSLDLDYLKDFAIKWKIENEYN